MKYFFNLKPSTQENVKLHAYCLHKQISMSFGVRLTSRSFYIYTIVVLGVFFHFWVQWQQKNRHSFRIGPTQQLPDAQPTTTTTPCFCCGVVGNLNAEDPKIQGYIIQYFPSCHHHLHSHVSWMKISINIFWNNCFFFRSFNEIVKTQPNI